MKFFPAGKKQRKQAREATEEEMKGKRTDCNE